MQEPPVVRRVLLGARSVLQPTSSAIQEIRRNSKYFSTECFNINDQLLNTQTKTFQS